MTKSIYSTHSLILDLPPSCVEFCPAFPSFFVVGTYNLERNEETTAIEVTERGDESQPNVQTKTQSRNGSIIAFQVLDKTM